MAHPAVIDAVNARLAALWTRCPVVEMNTTGEAPQDGSPYLLVQYPASRSDALDVEPYDTRESGGIRFVLFMLAGEGTSRPKQWAQELAEMFRRLKPTAFGGVETQDPTSPFFDDSNDVGGYFIVTVVVPYTFDYSTGD